MTECYDSWRERLYCPRHGRTRIVRVSGGDLDEG